MENEFLCWRRLHLLIKNIEMVQPLLFSEVVHDTVHTDRVLKRRGEEITQVQVMFRASKGTGL
jgi:hypothetical protein